MLKAGVSIVDISPKKGVRLVGYPHATRANKGVHDPLYAGCLYLDNGDAKVAFVTLDLLYIGKKQAAAVRSEFKDMAIMFSASHTHSGPGVCSLFDTSEKDDEYISFLVEKLKGLIKEARAGAFDAMIGFASGRCGAEQGIGGNRRDKNGPCDPSVNVIAVKDYEGKVRGVLLNYALHPTYLHAENNYVSADYPAYIRRFFHFARPEAVFLFAQGASGNQSSRYFRVGQTFEEAARAGTTIAVEGNRCIDNMDFAASLDISVKSREVDLPFKELPDMDTALKNLKLARKKFRQSKKGSYIEMRNAELNLFGAENTVNYIRQIEQGRAFEELPCELQLVRLNDNLIVGIQGEIFVEYGLEIKSISPFRNTFVFTNTNGALGGYVCTPESLKEGGYEAGTTIFSQEAGSVIVNNIKEMIADV